MAKISVVVLIFIFSKMYVTTRAQERETLHDSENDPPSTYSLTYPIDDDDSGGEICDPNKQRACDYPMTVCAWSPQDMLYKCIQRSHENKRSHRKRVSPRKENVTPLTTSGDGLKEEQLTTIPTSRVPTLLRDNRSSVSTSHPLKHPRRKLKVNRDLAISRLLRNLDSSSGDNEDKVGTRDIPKYWGTITWDGDYDNNDECITKDVMADVLQGEKPMQFKKDWVEENKHQICNFERFFHCTVEKPDTELDMDDDEEEEVFTGDNTPTCRCYESTMPVTRNRCYIPADFGQKSSCGDHIIAPYPVQAWPGAPLLQPICTPNSDCRESQYWFGKRCTCRYNAKWNSQTHACDNAKKVAPMTALLLLATVFCLGHH